VFKYTLGVTIGDYHFYLDFNHEATALTAFDSLAADTDNEMEDYLEVPSNATVSKVSLRRTFVQLRLGDPNQVST
jgi:hypothetical protein